MTEAARLLAVPENLERFPGQRTLDEAGHHHPVLPGLAGADGVEQPGDDAVETPFLVVREREELVHGLRVCVRPAPLRRRSVYAARLLVQRVFVAMVAVDLRRRCDQHALPEAVAVLEHDLGALEVRDQGVHRLLDDEPDADGRCKVVDDITLVYELVDDGAVEHGIDHEVEVCVAGQVLDVRQRARGEVVERPDLPTLIEEELAEVGADEPCPARDQGFAPPPCRAMASQASCSHARDRCAAPRSRHS